MPGSPGPIMFGFQRGQAADVIARKMDDMNDATPVLPFSLT